MADFIQFSKGKKIATFAALLLILLFPLFLFLIASVFRSSQKVEYAPNQIIIKYTPEYTPDKLKDGPKKQKLAEVLQQAGVTSQERMFDTQEGSLQGYYLLHLKPGSDVLRVRDYLRTYKEIGIPQPNYAASAQVVPNDSLYSQYLWGPKKIGMEQAWDITQGSKDVIVAVVDTGVDYTHEDLPTDIIKGKDFVNNDSDPIDDNGHGTHLAGTIGAIANNSKGITGISWNAKIMAVKVLDNQGKGFTDAISSGVKYAVDNGAKVVNLSLTADSTTPCSQSSDPLWADAVKYAIDRGVVVVAAAGNQSGEATNAPASCEGAISVGAIDVNDARGSFSNYGDRVDIAAPGVNVLSTRASNCQANWCNSGIIGGKYIAINGTSMATPHVAAVASLLLAMKSNLTPAQVRACIKNNGDAISTDRPIGPRLNATKVLNACGKDTTIPPPTPGASGIRVFLGDATNKTTPIQSRSFTPNSSQTLNLYIDSPSANVNGFDVTITTTGGLIISKLDEGQDAGKFSTKVFNDLSNGGQTIRFSKVSTDTNATITGLLHLGTITFAVPGSGTGKIDFTKITLTSPDVATALLNTKYPVDYTIGSAQVSPTPTTPPVGGTGVSVYFADPSKNTIPITKQAFNPSSAPTMNLFINTGTNNLNGFDVTITTTGGLTITKVDEAADAAKFGTKVFADVTNAGHTLRYAKVSTDTNATIKGVLSLGTVTFSAPAGNDSGVISFFKITITSPDSNTALPNTKFDVNYTIGNPTTSPVPTTVQPTATPKPTSVPPPTVKPTMIPTSGPTQPPIGGIGVGVYFAENGNAITTKTFAPNSSQAIALDLNAGQNNINGFDITITTTGGVTITKVDEGADAGKFNTKLFADVTNGGAMLRYAKVSTDTNAVIKGVLHIGSVTFAAPASGNGKIDFSKVTITSPDSSTALPFTKIPVDYTIGTGTISPTSPVASPAPTSTPQPCIVVNPTKVKAGKPLKLTIQDCATPTPGQPQPTAVPTVKPTGTPPFNGNLKEYIVKLILGIFSFLLYLLGQIFKFPFPF